MPRHLTQLNLYTLLLASCALTACGGGGGGGGASETLNTQTTPPVETPTSTRLIDNPAPANASFDSYAQVSVAIPEAASTAVFIGSNRYIKIALTSGDVLYLGIVPDALDHLPLSLPVGTTRLKYELFTDSAYDTIVFGEIVL